MSGLINSNKKGKSKRCKWKRRKRVRKESEITAIIGAYNLLPSPPLAPNVGCGANASIYGRCF
ncbi:MAG: hypothetical protein LBF42_00450, partial [Puniceicoccales bacterium]|nr:hypothetical protein [Puniceicoccales bacterium]